MAAPPLYRRPRLARGRVGFEPPCQEPGLDKRISELAVLSSAEGPIVLQSSQCSAATRPGGIPLILQFLLDDIVILYLTYTTYDLFAPRLAPKCGANAL